MNTKSFFFIALFFLVSMGIFFVTNPSYEKSLQAKYFYEMGEYEEAYTTAKEAFKLDPYNKMATTIMTQSQFSLRYLHFINQAKEYLQKIEQIVQKKQITQADKAKIRIMCQIIIDEYKKLAPSVVVDTHLIQEAQNYYEQFQKLLQKAY